MAVFLNSQDEQRCLIRTWFNRELGREPSTPDEQNAWVATLVSKGADLTLAGLRDSAEAVAFRAKRGW